MDAGHEEEFDEAFFLELNAAEAAAVASSSSSTRQQRDAAGVASERGLEQACSTRMSSTQRACAHGTASGVNLSWKVDSIAVRDDDAVAEESAEERIGEGTLTVNCRLGPASELLVVNVVVTAAGRDGSAMDIPRHAITQLRVDGDPSSPSKPSPVARGQSSAPPPFVLLLCLEIGCSIVMSGLERQEEQDGSPLPIVGDRNRSNSNSGAGSSGVENESAALGVGCSPRLSPLPTVTPERRRLAPTEFATPSAPVFSLTQQSDDAGGGGGGNVPPVLGVVDPVLAKLVRDFDDRVAEKKRAARSFSSSAPSGSTRPPAVFCGGSNSGGHSVAGHGEVTMMPPASPSPSACETQGGDGKGSRGVCTGEDQGRADDDASRRPISGVASSSRVVDSGAAGEEKKKGRRLEECGVGAEGGGGGGGGDGGGIVGCGKKPHKSALSKMDEGVEVPDEDWRRPLAASPSNRRRSAAGRRKPRVRHGPRNASGGAVVLHLDGDEEGGVKKGDGRTRLGDVVAAAAPAARGGGGIVDPGGERRHEEEPIARPNKRPSAVVVAAGGSAGHSPSGVPGKRFKTAPPLPRPQSLPAATPAEAPARGGKARGEASWLALRKALHERYRDCEEHGAAEQAAVEAARREREGWGGSRAGVKGGRGGGSSSGGGGWGGEVMYPGLRTFRRQEQAFTYADALAARLSPEDAARYKVLSFETNSTGSRKFLVCDVRRFEDRYPYTVSPDRSLLLHLPRPESPAGRRRRPSQSSTPLSPSSPRQERKCPNSVVVAEEEGGGRGKNSGDAQNAAGSHPPPSMAVPPLILAAPKEQQQQQQKQQQQQQQQQQLVVSSAGDGGSAAVGVSAAVPLRREPEQKPSPSSSPPPSASPLRHVYEIIRDGCPCRMYFDLEFSRGCNPGLDGEELVRAWINVVAGKLHQDLGIGVGGASFLDLDSSTPKKFSRHLILHLPGDQLFRDNSHVGRFVNSLAADLEAWRPSQPRSAAGPAQPGSAVDPHGGRFSGGTPSPDGDVPTAAAAAAAAAAVTTTPATAASVAAEDEQTTAVCGSDEGFREMAASDEGADGDAAGIGGEGGGGGGDGRGGSGSGGGGVKALEKLWVKDADGRSLLFADVSVYTRNRCFRLLGSSKFGKSAALEVAATNRRGLEHMVWRGAGGALSARAAPGETRRQPRDVARTLLHDSLVVPATLRPPGERYICIDGGGAGHHRYSRFGRGQAHPSSSQLQPQQQQRQRQGSKRAGRGSEEGIELRTTAQGFGPSPFPAVDSFLRTLICQGGTRGELRQWSYTSDGVPHSSASRHVQESGADNDRSPSATVVRKLTHQVANNRWCWNIGRAHKSNHVFLVTDLTKGEARQHCHDQECRRLGYRSNPVRLPLGAAPSRDDLEAFELELGLAEAMRDSPEDWAAVA